MTEQLPAPNVVLYLVKCACAKSKCATNRCSCRKAGLNCTYVCSCSDRDDDVCENMEDEHEGVVGDCDDDDDDDDCEYDENDIDYFDSDDDDGRMSSD